MVKDLCKGFQTLCLHPLWVSLLFREISIQGRGEGGQRECVRIGLDLLVYMYVCTTKGVSVCVSVWFCEPIGLSDSTDCQIVP